MNLLVLVKLIYTLNFISLGAISLLLAGRLEVRKIRLTQFKFNCICLLELSSALTLLATLQSGISNLWARTSAPQRGAPRPQADVRPPRWTSVNIYLPRRISASPGGHPSRQADIRPTRRTSFPPGRYLPPQADIHLPRRTSKIKILMFCISVLN